MEKVYGLDEILSDAARASAEPGRRGKILLRPLSQSTFISPSSYQPSWSTSWLTIFGVEAR